MLWIFAISARTDERRPCKFQRLHARQLAYLHRNRIDARDALVQLVGMRPSIHGFLCGGNWEKYRTLNAISAART